MAFPSQILSVTVTNKAAREMRHRVGTLIGDAVEGLPWLGTFHSIAAKILRIHAELVGLKSSFTILDTDDQIRLLKQVIKAENIDEKKWTARYMASLIDSWKNKGWLPEKVNTHESFKFADGKGRKIYEIYQARLKVLTNIRIRMSANIYGCASLHKDRIISASLVMMTSRFMAGAARRWITFCALKRTSLVQRSSSWNVITARRNIYSARLQALSRPIKDASAKRSGPKMMGGTKSP